jgi:hypothetical protein
MSDVVFDYSEFISRFPHIEKAVEEGRITQVFVTETYNSIAHWLGDTDSNSMYPYDPAKNIYTRKTLLYLATCHLLSISLWGEGQNGRITSASQGSVSTSFDVYHANSDTADWWGQTPCGRQYWIMSGAYRRGGRVYIHKEWHPWG